MILNLHATRPFGVLEVSLKAMPCSLASSFSTTFSSSASVLIASQISGSFAESRSIVLA